MPKLRSAAALAAAFCAIASSASAQSGFQRVVQDSREFVIEFTVTQGTDCTTRGSNDQITIVFSNQSGDSVGPTPALGDDVAAEFSFSARDLVNQRLQFRRRVRDRSFLDARFIRVVNLNGDGWCPGRLAATIDGARLFDVALSPRKGRGTGGLQDWNRGNWAVRTYWEANLQQLLRSNARK